MIEAADITRALARLGVERDDALFVHSGLQSAMRVAGRRPAEKIDTIVKGLADAVPDGVLGMPTFTYSYTDGAAYEPDATPSTVGALTERFRGSDGVRRTMEPNFSAAFLGAVAEPWDSRLFSVGDSDAFGENGVFGYLRSCNAKLLFFGVSFEYCTYVHHVEQRAAVPYRYFKDFDGIVRHEGRERPTTARYFVRELDADVWPFFTPLAEELRTRGLAASEPLARGPRLFLTDTSAVELIALERLEANPDFLLRRGHPDAGEHGAHPDRVGAHTP